MIDRTVELDQGDLTAGVATLASASQALQLTSFVAIILMFLLDALIAFLGVAPHGPPSMGIGPQFQLSAMDVAELLGLFLLPPFFVVGLVSLALNIPLLLKASRERARLKALGLGSLSESLLLEHRQRRWIRRVPRAVLRVSCSRSFSCSGIFCIGS
jgi:hypothetical protein